MGCGVWTYIDSSLNCAILESYNLKQNNFFIATTRIYISNESPVEAIIIQYRILIVFFSCRYSLSEMTSERHWSCRALRLLISIRIFLENFSTYSNGQQDIMSAQCQHHALSFKLKMKNRSDTLRARGRGFLQLLIDKCRKCKRSSHLYFGKKESVATFNRWKQEFVSFEILLWGTCHFAVCLYATGPYAPGHYALVD